MKKYGIGIIGTGSIAVKQAQAIRELKNASLVGLFNPNPQSAASAKKSFNEPVFSNLNEFLSIPELDVLCICTPSGMHLEPGIAGAKAGKHIMVEKPIEINLNRTDQLIQSCEENAVQLAVIFQNRFSEDYKKLKREVDKGTFGRLLMGNAYVNWFRDEAYYGTSKWKGTLKGDGGGALINQGIHTIDLLLDLMGDVSAVYGQVQSTLYDIEGEDLGAAVVNFKNGSIGNITAATALYPGYPERIELFGTKGSAILEAGKLVEWNLRGVENVEIQKEASSGSGSSDPNAIGYQLHLEQWQLFLEAIDKKQTPVVDGKTARKSVELIRAIYLSSKQNQKIEFPFKDDFFQV
ncbi:Gfo/Idh/MocA family protein [Algoriphagus machipongonensis]|uniref:Dehydrogenase n=1 Tax=Algoriphagus machipongonensis TaxID=388413 RepID=A3HWQ5_9BACT|nr:Gfo/Idh/MocA family oxidoreductase [Algoriphagus machipongonensis]EAZ81028.1 dehydrogenase [Algoriphagus machipongonensis]